MALALVRGALVALLVLLPLGRMANVWGQEAGAALAAKQEARSLAAEGQLEAALDKAREALQLARAEFGERHAVTAFILDDLSTLSFRLGRLEDALAWSEQALPTMVASSGENSIGYAVVSGNRATILAAQGRFRDALPLYSDAHATFVRELGKAHERTAQNARNLGIAYAETGQFERARTFFEEAVRAREALDGGQSPSVGRALLELAGAELRLEDLAAARQATLRARSIFDTQAAPAPSDLAESDIMLARIDIQESRLNVAEARLEGALARLEQAGAADSAAAAAVLYNRAAIYILRRQAVAAEQILKRVLQLYRRQVGEGHPAVARTLHSLAIIYGNLDQPAEAERLFRRATSIYEASFGALDPSVAASRLELGLLLAENGRAEAAIVEAEAALRIYGQLPDRFRIQQGYATSALGFALKAAGRPDEAAAALERATLMMREIQGADSSDLAPGLTTLGQIYLEVGDLAAAEARVQDAIRIQKKDATRTGPALATTLAVLANIRLAQERPPEALALMDEASALMQDRLEVADRSLSAAAPRMRRAGREIFEQHLEVARIAAEGEPDGDLLARVVEIAQMPHFTPTTSGTTRVRFSDGTSPLARLLRQRQDAIEAWQAHDSVLTDRLAAGQLQPGEEDSIRADLEALAGTIEQQGRELRDKFPAFAELVDPRPAPLGAVQALLREGEALLIQVTGEASTHLLLIRPDGARYARSNLGAAALEELVRRLRASLDLLAVPSQADLPPFDGDAAHALYRALIQPLEPALGGVDHLIIVPDRAMQSLPPALLLSAPAGPVPPLGNFADLPFLIERFALTVVPAPDALSSLRTSAERSNALNPFVGFGAPDFAGQSIGGSRGVAPDLVFPNATGIDQGALRNLPRLTEAEGELRFLARSLNAGTRTIYLDTQASEQLVKALDLTQYRTIAFATHGLLAGDFNGLAEPALALSPPEAGSDEDGLLTASEVAGLELDAALVILSATSTAGPDGADGAAGVADLARAFVYAGARTVMVSHWYVGSEAVALLTSGTAEALEKDPAPGPSQALRASMLRLLRGERGAAFAHPVFWAPFVMVGEGAGPQS